MLKSIASWTTALAFTASALCAGADDDLYTWPRYSQAVQDDMAEFMRGDTFGMWNYDGIYTDTPNQYAESMGAQYGIFCGSGTAGLTASLLALGLKPGDEVVVPSMTFIRSVTPLVHMGIVPILVDVDLQHGNLDPEQLRKVNRPGVRAVVVVHMWGVPADMESIVKICRERDWKIIEDFSHAHYSRCNLGYVGSIGDVGFASIQRKKTISVGEGGLIITSQPDLFDRLREITSPGSFSHLSGIANDFSGFGLNLRMAPTAAVIARSLLKEKDEIISGRRATAEQLRKMLAAHPDIFGVPAVPAYAQEVTWFSVRFKGHVSLGELIAASRDTRWHFVGTNYPCIADHVFWNKDKTYFPFCQEIQLVEHSLENAREYVTDLYGVQVPNMTAAAWTADELSAWERDLELVCQRVRASRQASGQAAGDQAVGEK